MRLIKLGLDFRIIPSQAVGTWQQCVYVCVCGAAIILLIAKDL